MEISSEIDKTKNIFILHISGIYRRPGDGFEAQRFVLDSFAEHGCRKILLDLRQATVVSGTMATYQTANPEAEIAVELIKFSFAALYPEITKDERFFEDAATNRGLRVRAFDNIDAAVGWLEKERK